MRPPAGSLLGRIVLAARGHVPVRDALIAAEVAFRADVVQDRVIAMGMLDEVPLVGAALLALLRPPADVLPAEHPAVRRVRPEINLPVRKVHDRPEGFGPPCSC